MTKSDEEEQAYYEMEKAWAWATITKDAEKGLKRFLNDNKDTILKLLGDSQAR